MSQPFVVSLKLQGDSKDAVAAISATRKEMDALQNAAVQSATGAATTRQTLVGTLEREQAAVDVVTAATHANTAAIAANDNALRRANAQRTNLLFQLQDVGVSLASGMNPLMVAAQQGSQISMIYGPEEGGLGRALQETGKMAAGLAARFWPVGLAIGAGAAAIAGIRHEIEQTSGKAVSFGDVMLASFQVPAKFLYDKFRPQIEAIQGWFAKAWDAVIDGVKFAGNGMIARFMLTFETLKFSISSIPDVFLVAGQSAANYFLGSIEDMVKKAMLNLNSLFDGINGLLERAGMQRIVPFDVGSVDFGRVDIGGDAAIERLSAGAKDYEETVRGIVGRDYMGEYFQALSDQAISNMNGRLEETKDAAGNAAQGVSDLRAETERFDAAAKALNQEIDFYRDTWRSLFSDMRRGLQEGQSWWDAFGNAGANALDRIADRALGMAADGIFNMILGALMPGYGQTGGTWGAGLWGSAIFNAQGNVYSGSPSLSAYSNQVVDRPTLFAFAKGAGVMGEAGPEAIVPLTRTRSGDLGVRMVDGAQAGAGQIVVNINNTVNAPGGASLTESEFRRLLDDNNRRVLDAVPDALAEARWRAHRGT